MILVVDEEGDVTGYLMDWELAKDTTVDAVIRQPERTVRISLGCYSRLWDTKNESGHVAVHVCTRTEQP